MSERRNGPYIWVTWITGILAGDDSCGFSAWFKAHNKYDKVQKDDNTLKQWKADHGAMVKKRAEELRKAGYTVYLEDQNKFTMTGKTGIALAGTPDIVAVWQHPEPPPHGIDAIVVDCKSGKRRDKDYWQVCIYMMVLPHTHDACKGRRIHGEVRYQDAPLKIHPDEEEEIRDKIVKQIGTTGGDQEQRKVPSRRECRFCDITKADCPKRVDDAPDVQPTHTGMF